MRGEHGHVEGHARHARGSSPHARGTRVEILRFGAFFGIIPACAGNTPRLESVSKQDGDHPRMRGEHRLLPA